VADVKRLVRQPRLGDQWLTRVQEEPTLKAVLGDVAAEELEERKAGSRRRRLVYWKRNVASIGTNEVAARRRGLALQPFCKVDYLLGELGRLRFSLLGDVSLR